MATRYKLISLKDKASGADISAGTDDAKFATALALSLRDGWQATNETWTRASNNTINVPSGATSKYQIGDKLKFTDTTVKYFYVTAVADTLLTVYAGTDFIVVGNPSSSYFSRSENPFGFPEWFTWAPTLAVASGGTVPTYANTYLNRFCIKGRTLFGKISWYNASGGTPGAGTGAFSLTQPVNIANYAMGALGSGIVYEAGGTDKMVEVMAFNATTIVFATYLDVYITGDDQSSASRSVQAHFSYEI